MSVELTWIGNGGYIPLGLLPFTIGITTYYSSLPAVSTAGLVPSALRLSLSTRLTCSTNMATVESARRCESTLRSFSQSWYGHLPRPDPLCIVSWKVRNWVLLCTRHHLASINECLKSTRGRISLPHEMLDCMSLCPCKAPWTALTVPPKTGMTDCSLSNVKMIKLKDKKMQNVLWRAHWPTLTRLLGEEIARTSYRSGNTWRSRIMSEIPNTEQ